MVKLLQNTSVYIIDSKTVGTMINILKVQHTGCGVISSKWLTVDMPSCLSGLIR